MEESTKSVRRNKKVAGVDDPIVIIQRFLNIFRQLHILNDEQKENFNNMILQQPPEIRHMCSVLPGGSLLQEYIDELEETRGIAPDQRLDGGETQQAETTGSETILASAMEDKKTPPAPTSRPETAPQPSAAGSEDMQRQMMQMMQAMQQNLQPQTTAIKTDPGFAKEVASAISSALAASDQQRRKETQELTKTITESQMQMTKALVDEIAKGSRSAAAPAMAVNADGQNVRVIDNTQEITKAITESQLEMAKMFLQHNAITASASSANNANNIQINNAPANFNQQEFIGDIIKAQSQLFREMAKEQTKELSAIISVALRESSELSNKHLINALTAFQKENMKFLKEQAKNQNQPIIHYAAPTADNTVYEYVEQEVPAEETPKTEEPSYIKKVFGNVFNRVHKEPEDILPEAQDPSVETLPTGQNDTSAETDGEPATDETADNQYAINGDGLGLSNTETQSKKKKKKKKKNKNKNNAADIQDEPGYVPIYAGDNSSETGGSNTDVHKDTAFSSVGDNSFGLDTSLFDLSLPATNAATDISAAEEENDDFPKLDMSIFDDDNTVSDSEDLFFQTEDDTEEKPSETPMIQADSDDAAIPADNVTEAENASLSAQDITNVEWEEAAVQQPVSSIETNPAVVNAETETAVDETQSAVENTETGAHTRISHASFIPDLEDPDAVEALMSANDSLDQDNESVDLDADYKIALEQNAQETEAEDNPEQQDWEWEYEEVEDDTADATAAPVEAQSGDENDGDWEWEYEEVEDDTADATTAPVEAQSGDENDGDWEWEYEEVEDDTADATAAPVEAQSGDENDGDWEWEYEEVEDYEHSESEGVQTADVSENTGDTFADATSFQSAETSDENASQPFSTTDEKTFDAEETPLTDDFDLSHLHYQEEQKTQQNQDPYGAVETGDDFDLGLNSLQSGSLYFQQDVVSEHSDIKPQKAAAREQEEDIVMPGLNDDENSNEPYKLNSDLKP